MKKLIPMLFVLFLSFQGRTQITLEQSYSYSGTFTNLAVSGDKFYVMDVILSQCRIYNTNYSLWKTINLSVPANNYLYDIQYISENLFTTDNSLCLIYTYYSYDATNLYYTYTTKVVKENGTVLLTVPGCQYYYVTTMTSGAAKLVTYSFDYSVSPYTVSTAVYSIPGSLPTSMKENAAAANLFPVSAFPNPASEQLSLSYTLPSGVDSGILQVTDVQGRLVRSIPVSGSSDKMQMGVSDLPRGMYFYTIASGNFRSQAVKIILR
jgi:hypothetical protein